jgi:hypothetical protein
MSMNCTLYAIPEAAARQVLAKADFPDDFFEVHGRQEKTLSLHKRWHGLHFVLTGTAWEGKDPLCFLVSGGEAAGEEGEDEAEVLPRVLLPAYVKKLDKALAALTDHDFERRFDLKRLAKEQIYPRIWDEPRESLLAEYRGGFEELRRFVRQAAQAREALLIRLD